LLPKSKWCGWDLTPAWFPISSQRIGGEPAYLHKEGGCINLSFFV